MLKRIGRIYNTLTFIKVKTDQNAKYIAGKYGPSVSIHVYLTLRTMELARPWVWCKRGISPLQMARRLFAAKCIQRLGTIGIEE